MSNSQEIGIKLDSRSIDILKTVDALHRDSLINVGLALVSKTGYYKTLSGIQDSNELENVVSLDVEDKDKPEQPNKSNKPKKTEVETPVVKKPAASWDTF